MRFFSYQVLSDAPSIINIITVTLPNILVFYEFLLPMMITGINVFFPFYSVITGAPLRLGMIKIGFFFNLVRISFLILQ